MLPSPGFSIPSIGTPMHQPEEDQQIVAANPYAHHTQQMNSMATTPNHIGGFSGMGNPQNPMSMSSGLPSLMNTPTKQMQYTPSYAGPQSMMQPQTPVRIVSL